MVRARTIAGQVRDLKAVPRRSRLGAPWVCITARGPHRASETTIRRWFRRSRPPRGPAHQGAPPGKPSWSAPRVGTRRTSVGSSPRPREAQSSATMWASGWPGMSAGDRWKNGSVRRADIFSLPMAGGPCSCQRETAWSRGSSSPSTQPAKLAAADQSLVQHLHLAVPGEHRPDPEKLRLAGPLFPGLHRPGYLSAMIAFFNAAVKSSYLSK
jgi:hypothetical protein